MRIIKKNTPNAREQNVTPEIWKQMEKLGIQRFYKLLDAELTVEKKDFSVKKIIVEKQLFNQNPKKAKTKLKK